MSSQLGRFIDLIQRRFADPSSQSSTSIDEVLASLPDHPTPLERVVINDVLRRAAFRTLRARVCSDCAVLPEVLAVSIARDAHQLAAQCACAPDHAVSGTRQALHPVVQRALRVIGEQHSDRTLTFTRVATLVGASRSYLDHLIVEQTGAGFRVHVHRAPDGPNDPFNHACHAPPQ